METTEVIFRRDKKTGEIFAIFPYEIWNGYFVTGICKSEGHFSCDYDYVLESSIPTKEYDDFYKWLTNVVGYENLKVIQKKNHKKYLKAYYKQFEK